jgi:CubicO group peptidase (beta-lactamase class C family)
MEVSGIQEKKMITLTSAQKVNWVSAGMMGTRKIVFLLIFVFGTACDPTFSRIIRYRDSDVFDFKLFPGRRVQGNTLTFSIPAGRSRKLAGLDDLMKNETLALLVMRNDTIVFEKYAPNFGPDSLAQYFSMTKSIMSLLIGCAIADGLINSELDLITRYIPELQSAGFNQRTILDLLQMRAQVNYTENDSPFGRHARFYYTDCLEEEILNLSVDPSRNREFNYQSCNTAILGLILKRALDSESVAQYLSRRLWLPAGMSDNAIWTTDKENGLEKTWCCLAGTARDFLRVGQLVAHYGTIEGTVIVPKNWMDKILTDSTNANARYNRHWWLYPEFNAVAAIGKDGQFAFIVPSKNLVIVRTGTGLNGLSRQQWLEIFNKITTSL